MTSARDRVWLGALVVFAVLSRAELCLALPVCCRLR